MSVLIRTRRSWGAVLAIAALLCAGARQARCQEASPAPQPVAEAQAAPPPTPRRELPPELRKVLDKLDEANAQLVDVRARVTYERAIPLLDNKQKSKGTLVFKKPDRLILKLGKPRNEEVHTNGRLWWVVSKDDKQVEVYKAAAEGEGTREAAFLNFGYGQSSEQLLKDYDVELVEVAEIEGERGKATAYRLKFTPVERPDQPARYAAIEVEVSDELWLPHVLVLHESDGEILHTYTLSKLTVNTDVEDAEFEYEPPRGYNVVPLHEP